VGGTGAGERQTREGRTRRRQRRERGKRIACRWRRTGRRLSVRGTVRLIGLLFLSLFFFLCLHNTPRALLWSGAALLVHLSIWSASSLAVRVHVCMHAQRVVSLLQIKLTEQTAQFEAWQATADKEYPTPEIQYDSPQQAVEVRLLCCRGMFA
jgi:hypothetical protein